MYKRQRYILAGDAPDRALVMYSLALEHARLDLQAAQGMVRTRSRYKQAQACAPEVPDPGTVQMTEKVNPELTENSQQAHVLANSQ